MQPVAIFQHDATQRPGYILDFLQRHDIPWRAFLPDEGDELPTRARDFSGLIFLGSPHSVNDPLPWIAQEAQLIKDALAQDRPILGHCFGGQLLAKTLGAPVVRNAFPHIGWGNVMVTRFDEARNWFGEPREINLFHWHYETFGIPAGAKRTLFGRFCINKGFSIGKHLGLQCHLEVTADSVREWCAKGRSEIESHPGRSVQTEAVILNNLEQKISDLHRVADRVYSTWVQGLAGNTRPLVAAANQTLRRESWGLSLAR